MLSLLRDELNPASKFKSSSSSIVDNEIAQLTRLRLTPHGRYGGFVHGGAKLPVSTVKMLAGRETNCSGIGRFSSADKCHITSQFLPTKGPWRVDRMDSRVYVSQFSADGLLFIAGSQAGRIQIYDVERDWEVRKDIQFGCIKRAIFDISLSRDNRLLVYSSLSPVLHIVNIECNAMESVVDTTDIPDGLEPEHDDELGIYSVKFSIDGREIVAGSNDGSIYIYDIESNRPGLKFSAHEDAVNTVCFADETGHIIYSGSDDSLCKVWDKRCAFTDGKSSGFLMGHLRGVTFIDSHGDGRYLISNGKDQTTKLWDIRKMSSQPCYNCVEAGDDDCNCRWMNYMPPARSRKHPRDQSVATYTGHRVLRSLIRCYFSPVYSTGQKFIYTGSFDNCVYIYDLVSGAQVGKLSYHTDLVRDCSWHHTYPMIVSSSWDGDIIRWEFPSTGEPILPPKRVFPSRT